jgi:hypothetical protein
MKLRPGGRNGIAIVGRILAAGLCALVLASSASLALAAQRRALARMRIMITTRARSGEMDGEHRRGRHGTCLQVQAARLSGAGNGDVHLP